jgi:hypothetical protein
MSFFLIDVPRPVPAECYDEAMRLLIEGLARLEGLVSIIGFGNVSSPGISDVDLLAIFEDGAHASFDAREALPEHLRYVVTHNAAAMCLSHFRQSARFTAWHKHETLWGRDVAGGYRHQLAAEERKALEVQTALEFLVTNYIDLAIQSTYGIIKLRSLLQHVKALKYDLDFLGVASGPVHERVEEMRGWIQHWFSLAPGERPVEAWLQDFLPEYERFMGTVFARDPLFLPRRDAYRIAANATLRPGEAVGRVHTGLVLPSLLGALGRKFFNLQHRLNRFEFRVPMVHEPRVALLGERFEFFTQMLDYHRRHLGRFITLSPTLVARVA